MRFRRGAAANSNGAVSSSCFWSFQVQDLEFAQIEKKVIDGLKVGNQCLKKMHEVGDPRPGVAVHCSVLRGLFSSPSGDVH